jgi:geranylgeranyl pyrophosphate synthase
VLRAAHGGQAIDIDGLNVFMPEVVESGDGQLLERRVLAIHRLKTAVPAGVLSQMGAVVGGGSEEQIEAVGRYMEAIGLAFQAIDDVLDLRGFSKKLKKRGEDVRQGKVTLPVAKAMQVLAADKRRYLWNTLESKPQDEETVASVIELLESCGAVEACVIEANEIVEAAWIDFDRVIEDSFVKMMLRAFGWYVLQRHY